MYRQSFDQRLNKLQDELLILGSMVGGALVESVKVLKARDIPGSRRLIKYDERINQRRFDLEEDTLTFITVQQPLVRDIRILAAILEIATELERIGDYAKGIAKISLSIGQEPLAKNLAELPCMADAAQDMLEHSLQAFLQHDLEAARRIPLEDEAVDTLYNQVYRTTVNLVISNPQKLDQATSLLWVAHNLERAADRVTNICERVIFTVTGEIIDLDSHI